MGRFYVVEFENVAVTAAQDLFEFSLASTDREIIRLWSVNLSQSTDVGDAEEEMLRVQIIRGNTTLGSGGTADQENPIVEGDAAASFVGDINHTTEASAGTEVVLWSEAFNIRAGWQWTTLPEWQFTLKPPSTGSIAMVVRLLAAPTDSVTMNGTAIVEEIG